MARTALVYDFDGTLAPGSMQEHSFLPDVGQKSADFWERVKAITRDHNVDEILVYMWQMLEAAKAQGKPISKEALRNHGSNLPLFAGVDEWFQRINQFGNDRGLDIEHYIISSGNYEIIRGCPIFKEFKYIFASKYIFENDHAVWPGMAVNYTNKTQHIFRINKGITNIWDNSQINRFIPLDERPIPFERIVFIGDGETDIPAMKTVRDQGGQSIAVFDPSKSREAKSQAVLYNLIAENRVSFVAPADYSEGSQLDTTVKGALGRIARTIGYRE